MKKKATESEKPDEFLLRAERAFRRVAKNLRAEAKRAGVPLVVFKSGKAKA